MPNTPTPGSEHPADELRIPKTALPWLLGFLLGGGGTFGVTSLTNEKQLSQVDLDKIEALMSEHQVRRVPVVDQNNCIVGMIAQADLARELHANILQLHSKEYRNPSQIQEGGVLIVGAGNSGAEIAIELAPHHQTWLSGRDTGQEPTRAGSLPDRLITPILWFMATRVLTVKTPIGRKVRDHFLDPPRGIPLGRVRRKDFAAAGIERVPRVAGVRNGFPILDDGRTLAVSNVIWCTGFTSNYEWIDLSLPSRNGVPTHDRGIVKSCPGLYFLGLPFLYSLSSALLGGVGRDAKYIVDHIDSTRLVTSKGVRGSSSSSV